MTDADRMIEPLPDDVERLLDLERERGAPSGAEHAAVANKVASTLGVALGTGIAAAAGSDALAQGAGAVAQSAAVQSTAVAAKGTAVSAATGLGLKLALVSSVSLAVGGGAGYLAGTRAARSVATPSARGPTVPESVFEPVPEPAPEPASDEAVDALDATVGPQETASVLRSHPVRRSQTKAKLREERALIDRMRAALARGRGDAALATAREHMRRFPKGQLREERLALEVQAHAAAGQHDVAQRKARRFLKRFPRSIFAPSVRGLIEGAKTSDTR